MVNFCPYGRYTGYTVPQAVYGSAGAFCSYVTCGEYIRMRD